MVEGGFLDDFAPGGSERGRVSGLDAAGDGGEVVSGMLVSPVFLERKGADVV